MNEDEPINIKKSSFHPLTSPDKLSHYKPYYKIDRDGSIYERIFLDVPDPSLREQLICIHYLQSHSRLFCSDPEELTILSRDEPWDFKINSSKHGIFNVEITAISEDAEQFEKFKREERLVLASIGDKIPFHELVKLNKMFPNDQVNLLIESYRTSGISKTDVVDNPFKLNRPNFFISERSPITQPLEVLIKNAILSKEAKKHQDKDKTVLIIDNRTLSYKYSDLQSAFESLCKFYAAASFREMWFYTGYASELNGSNAEYSLAPLKATKMQWKAMEKRKSIQPPDKDGIMYF